MGDLLSSTEALVVPLVREFFSNSPDRTNNKIYVRGTWITFTKHVVNEYYWLPTLGDDEDYLHFLSEIDMATVSSIICKLGTVWKISGDFYRDFPCKALLDKV